MRLNATHSKGRLISRWAACVCLLLLCFLKDRVFGHLFVRPINVMVQFNESGFSLSDLFITCGVDNLPVSAVYAVEVSRVTAYPLSAHVLASASIRNYNLSATANLGVPGMSRSTVKGNIHTGNLRLSSISVTLPYITCQDTGRYICSFYYTPLESKTGNKVLIHSSNITVTVSETPSVAVSTGSPASYDHVYQPGTQLKITCAAFVGSVNFTWGWQERIAGVLGEDMKPSSFKPVTDGVLEILPSESVYHCRRLSASILTINVTLRHRQFFCYVSTPNGSFHHLGATYTVFSGHKPAAAQIPIRELNQPNVLDPFGGEEEWNFTDFHQIKSLMGDEVFLVLGGLSSALFFLGGVLVAGCVYMHVRRSLDFAATHASFYDRCGVGRRWGPGHAYLR